MVTSASRVFSIVCRKQPATRGTQAHGATATAGMRAHCGNAMGRPHDAADGVFEHCCLMAASHTMCAKCHRGPSSSLPLKPQCVLAQRPLFTRHRGMGFLLVGPPLTMYGAPHLLLLAWRWLQSQLLGLGFFSFCGGWLRSGKKGSG
jgi:hypothetical protein